MKGFVSHLGHWTFKPLHFFNFSPEYLKWKYCAFSWPSPSRPFRPQSNYWWITFVILKELIQKNFARFSVKCPWDSLPSLIKVSFGFGGVFFKTFHNFFEILGKAVKILLVEGKGRGCVQNVLSFQFCIFSTKKKCTFLL